MRPLIGVTTSELRPERDGDHAPPRRAPAPGDGAGDDVSARARRRRRDPRGAPPVGDAVAVAADASTGICLSGGPDLDPVGLRRARAPSGARADRASLDAFELALARAALGAGMPVLGDLPRRPGAQRRLRRHAAPAPRATARPSPAGVPTHDVQVVARLRLARILGAGTARRELLPPPGGRRGRRRPAGGRTRGQDGTIEAIEGAGFMLGVQWHAETMPRTCRCSRRWSPPRAPSRCSLAA